MNAKELVQQWIVKWEEGEISDEGIFQSQITQVNYHWQTITR
jgi:hypothetical protein